MPTLIDLFSGAGGTTRGFMDAGFEPVLAVEHELSIAATYAANFGEKHIWLGGIAELPDDEIPEVDVVCGSPPCQGFSSLGSQDAGDPRNQLWRQYLRVVRRAQPLVFVLENVPPFLKSAEYGAFMTECATGDLSEYTVTSGVLDAADYGVAQRRKRAIVIGSRIGPIGLPEATHAPPGWFGQTRGRVWNESLSAWQSGPVIDMFPARPWATVRSRIADLPETPDTTTLPKHTVTILGAQVPGNYRMRDLHLGRNPTALSLKRYDHVPPGGGRFDIPTDLLPVCWRNKPTGTTDVMGRMRWDHPACTIRTEFFKPEKGRYLHPQWDSGGEHRVNRPITHLEAALLQDFPYDYKWCGMKISIARQIGNAVPVGLANAIARHLLGFLR
jgi:DNA (cytosine-5)-methyltransferase 1